MTVSNVRANFQNDIVSVWNIVTNLENYEWRSDLSKIEVVNDTEFIEYTKEGYATNFKVTRCETNKCWEFDMDNANMKGHWKGVFTERDEQTMIDFTEEIEVKKFMMKPFVKGFLKKQQTLYIEDLRKALLKK